MRSLGIIGDFLIPNVFGFLGLFSGKKKAFKLDIWAVDDFFIDRQWFYPVSYLQINFPQTWSPKASSAYDFLPLISIIERF
jgi:hypothetical protein